MEVSTTDLMPTPQKRLPRDERMDLAIREEQGVSGPVSPRARAFELYMRENKRPAEIAAILKISVNQVAKWFASGRWVARRREQDAALVEEAACRHSVMVALERVKVAEAQLLFGEELEACVRETMETFRGSLTPRDAKSLAEAVVAATSIRARVVGISDRLPQSTDESRPQALLIIGAPPPQPAGPTPVEAIEAEADVVNTESKE